MSIKSGKLATGTSRAPMTVDQVKSSVQPIDTTIVIPLTVAAGRTLIIPNAQINVAVTVSAVTTFFGLEIQSGGSITISGSSVMQVGNGTAVAPSIAFTNSPTSGMFRKAADSVGFSAAGTEIGSFTTTGAWTLGPTAGAVNQTVRGFLQAATDGVTDGYFAPFTATRPGASTGPHIALVQRGVYAWGIGINHASNALQFGAIINANSYTDFGNCSSGAAWTLGNFSSVGASLTHAFRSGTETRLLIDSTGAAQAAYLQFGAKGGSPAVFEKTGTGSYLWRNGAGISLLTIADSGLANFSGIPAANESIIASGKIRSSQIPNTTRASGTFTTNGSGTVTLSLVGWSWGNFLSYDRCMLVTVAVVSAANQEVLGQVYLSVGPGMSLISERKQKGSVTWSATFSFGNNENAGSRFFVLAGAIANTVYTYEISGLSFRHDLQGEI